MRVRRWSVMLAVVTATLTVVLGPAAQADQTSNGPIFTVMNTSETPPDGVWFRNSPHTADTDRVTGHGVYMNERVQLRCYSRGDAVGAYNNTLWYKVLNVTRPTNAGVENSGFLNAHYINDGLLANQIDAGVPDCSAQAAAPAVTLAQGPSAPAGYRYAITLDHFPANSSISVSCYDSVSPGGFYTFNLGTDSSGHAFTESYCYSGDGPDHWVVANGVQSNHISWGSSGGGSTPPGAATARLSQGRAATAGYWYGITLTGFAPSVGVSVTCYDSVSPGGFITFSLRTDASGSASSQASCFSGDGPEHWVVAGGIESNHLTWGNAVPVNGSAPVANSAPSPPTASKSAPANFGAQPQRCSGDPAGKIVDKLSVSPDNIGSKITILPGPKGKVPWYADNSKIAAATTDMWNIMAPCLKKLHFTMTAAQTKTVYYQLNCHFYDQRISTLAPFLGGFGGTYDMETWRIKTQIPTGNLALQAMYLNRDKNCNWT
jgi:hypothetical protein